jgi:hypothetical protein
VLINEVVIMFTLLVSLYLHHLGHPVAVPFCLLTKIMCSSFQIKWIVLISSIDFCECGLECFMRGEHVRADDCLFPTSHFLY